MRLTPLTGIDPPDTLTRRIREATREPPAMTIRPQLRNAIALIVASLLTVGVIATASQLIYGQPAPGLRVAVTAASTLVWVALGLLSLLVVSTFAALRRGRSGLGASSALLTATAMMTAPLYALFALAFPVHEPSTAIGAIHVSPWGARCIVLASLVGVAVLACCAYAMRAAAPVGPRIRSMALGSAAGAWAGLAVFVFCPSGDPVHVSIGHVLPVVGLTLAAAVALPAILKP